MADVPVTWLGHASFRVDSPEGKRIYVDPFLNGNPKCPESELEPERVDVIALTHGHGDHVGDTVALGKKFSPEIVALLELNGWLGKQGLDVPDMGPNKGGTVEAGGVKFTLVNAFHSSASEDGEYLGESNGLVLTFSNGTSIYFAGDTCVFSDMQLIGRIYSPDVAVLPIGGYFTMDPREAGVALELLGSKRCIPCHYGTFPVLTGTPDDLRKVAPGVEIIELQPGETTTV
jgi:L-ascorbate metabolism protein UlaG (beta-lactamase superfamily)